MPWVLSAPNFSKHCPLPTCVKVTGNYENTDYWALGTCCTRLSDAGAQESVFLSTLPADPSARESGGSEAHRFLSACQLGHSTSLWMVVLGIQYTYALYYKALVFLRDHWVDFLNDHRGQVY